MDKLKELYSKYKDVIPYAIFGVLTTVVNVVVYWVCSNPLKMSAGISTVVANILAVLFAYLTNRKWVFHSEAKGVKAITIEIISFFACRLVTSLIDILGMYVLVERLGLTQHLFDFIISVDLDLVIKVILNVVIIVLNYVASKLIIFAKKKN